MILQVCSSDAWLLGTDTGTWRRVQPQGATDADIPPAMCVCAHAGIVPSHTALSEQCTPAFFRQLH